MKISIRNLLIFGSFVGLLAVNQTAMAGYYQNCRQIKVGHVYIQTCQGGYQPSPWGPLRPWGPAPSPWWQPSPWGPPSSWGPVMKQCNTYITPWGNVVQRCTFY